MLRCVCDETKLMKNDVGRDEFLKQFEDCFLKFYEANKTLGTVPLSPK